MAGPADAVLRTRRPLGTRRSLNGHLSRRRAALHSPAMGIAERLFGSARDRFGKEVAARVRALDSVVRADYDPEKFQVVYQGADTQGSEPAVINLETVFRETQGAPAAVRKAAIGRLADVAALPPTPRELGRACGPRVRPVLRPVPADPKFDIVSRPAAPLPGRDAGHRHALGDALRRPRGPGALGRERRGGVRRRAPEHGAHGHRLAGRGAPRREGSTEPTRLTDNGDAYLTSLPLIQGWLATMHRIAGARPLAFPVSNNTLLIAYETDDAEAAGQGLRGRRARVARGRAADQPGAADRRRRRARGALPAARRTTRRTRR